MGRLKGTEKHFAGRSRSVHAVGFGQNWEGKVFSGCEAVLLWAVPGGSASVLFASLQFEQAGES